MQGTTSTLERVRVFAVSCLWVAVLSLFSPTGLILDSLAQGSQKVPPTTGWADTVLVNGKIATMNDTQRFAEALAVRNDRIAAVGTAKEIERYTGPQTRIIDLKGKTVVPGLVAAHDHPHLWMSEMHNIGSKLDPQWDRVGAIGRTPEDAVESIRRTIQRLVAQRKPGQWISIRTDEDGAKAIFDKMITTEELNRLAPNHAVLVSSEVIDFGVSKYGKVLTNNEAVQRAYEGYGTPLRSAMHALVMNTNALNRFKAEGVDITRLNATRTTVAIMLESVPKAVGYDFFGEAIRRDLQFWAETQGVTTVVSTWFRAPTVLTAFSMLARQKKMPIRMAWYTDVEAHGFGSQEGVGDPYFWNAGVEYEGVVSEASMAFERDLSLWGTELAGAMTYVSALTAKDPRLERIKANYVNDALRGLPGMPGREWILRWLRQGVRVADVHCYSDGAIDMFISILKELQKETGWSDAKIAGMRNFYLTHNGLTRPDQFGDLAKFGMTVGPSWRTMHELIALKKAYGEEVKKYIWPVKSLLAAGVRVVPNMDMSPTVGPEGEGLWDALEFLVDREYAGEEWNKAEAVDRWSALKTVTILGAEVALRDDELGSLEVGKLADLAVLNKDYFSVPVKGIGSIEPLLTVVGGKIIHQSDGQW